MKELRHTEIVEVFKKAAEDAYGWMEGCDGDKWDAITKLYRGAMDAAEGYYEFFIKDNDVVPKEEKEACYKKLKEPL